MDLKAERAHKHERVVELLAKHGLDAVLLTRRCNFSWYTCGARNYVGAADDAGNSTLLVTRQGAAVLTTNIEATRLAAEELSPRGIQTVAYSYADASERLAAFRQALGARRAAADVPLSGVGAAALPPEFDRLRWVLTVAEVQRYRAVCRDVVAAVEAVARRAEPGQTEDELAGMTAYELRRRGCLPWVLLAAADERMQKHRHPLPTGNRIEQYFMVAAGAERGGLIAACSRLAHFGKVPADLAARHEAVCTVDAALISATRPGAMLGDLFAEAQAAYAAAGFPDEWRMHHQGGSTGYLPREVRAGPGDKTAALDGQAFAWNPSIAGTKSEDTILCTAGGPQVLAAPTGWPVVRAAWKGFQIDRPAILER
ncbi:MAG: M24 family metallopeptidase [Planctomycetes bacterium]|nr:M24 family metallopeptidase [Planctomycetota bacterium]